MHLLRMDIALQLSPTGLTYALRPDTFKVEDVVGMYVGWPRYGQSRVNMTAYLGEQILVKRLIGQILDRSAAESAVLAFVDGTSQHRIDATRHAMEQADCAAFLRDPHDDGAIGLMKDWLSSIDDAEVRRLPQKYPNRSI